MNNINVTIIKTYMIEELLTVDEFCKKCDISTDIFYKIINNDRSVSFESIWKIAMAMNVELGELFTKKDLPDKARYYRL